MLSSELKKAKEAFVDRVDPNSFVKFESNIQYLEKLHSLLEKEFKIALLTGEPGIGKSMLLKQFQQESKEGVYLFDKPFFDLEEFKEKLKEVLGVKKNLFEEVEEKISTPITFILDEAQIYKEEFLEFLRVLADTTKVKLILSLHSLNDETLLAKEHFKSRIFTTITMKPPSKKELEIYLQKRLFLFQAYDLSSLIDKKLTSFVYNFTKGNFRETNRFMYKLFDIMEYFEQNKPTILNPKKISKKFLEMTALDLGYLK